MTLRLEECELLHSGNTESSAETRNGISRNSGKEPKTMENGQGLQVIETALDPSHGGKGQRSLSQRSEDI